jgi:hypothetical protein
MRYRTHFDCTFSVGIIIRERAHPSLQLEITKYYQRMYYWTTKGDENPKHLDTSI